LHNADYGCVRRLRGPLKWRFRAIDFHAPGKLGGTHVLLPHREIQRRLCSDQVSRRYRWPPARRRRLGNVRSIL
jgi:hypothetical protein